MVSDDLTFYDERGCKRTHGTPWGYTAGACRCDLCCEAGREYRRKARARKRVTTPPKKPVRLPSTANASRPTDVPVEVRRHAACKPHPTEWWFPGRGAGATWFEGYPEETEKALHICWSCLVQTECLVYAVRANESLGIWGGTFKKQRSQLRRWWAESLRDGSSPGTALPDADPSPAAVPAPPPGSSTARWPRLGGHHFHGDRIA